MRRLGLARAAGTSTAQHSASTCQVHWTEAGLAGKPFLQGSILCRSGAGWLSSADLTRLSTLNLPLTVQALPRSTAYTCSLARSDQWQLLLQLSSARSSRALLLAEWGAQRRVRWQAMLLDKGTGRGVQSRCLADPRQWQFCSQGQGLRLRRRACGFVCRTAAGVCAACCLHMQCRRLTVSCWTGRPGLQRQRVRAAARRARPGSGQAQALYRVRNKCQGAGQPRSGELLQRLPAASCATLQHMQAGVSMPTKPGEALGGMILGGCLFIRFAPGFWPPWQEKFRQVFAAQLSAPSARPVSSGV